MPATETIDLSNVRPRPPVIDRLPGINPAAGTALYPNVYVGRALYEDLHSPAPDQYHIGLVVHEQEHINRIRARGVITWYFKYFASSEFRVAEELAASHAQFRYLKAEGLSVNLEQKAKFLSSWAYLRPIGYEQALQKLTALWEIT